MTQELVLAALVSGLLGLLWVMRLAVVEGNDQPEQHQDSETSGDNDRETALKHQTVAA
jgi:hypothetical protein